MSEDYWYPFYPFRYQRDTMHLTAEQDGAYRRLIDHYMITKRPLPDNDTALARIAGLDATSNAISMLRAFFKHKDDGFLYHETCEKHLKEQASRKMLNKKRAKNAALKRWEKQEDNAHSMPEAMLNDATYTNTKTNTVREEDKSSSLSKPKRKKVTLEELSVNHITDWLAKKRGAGKYIYHDEHDVLEYFKTYCQSKNKRYSDYVAAYRLSFDWERNQPKENQHGKKHRGREAIAKGLVNFEGGQGGEMEPNVTSGTMLRLS